MVSECAVSDDGSVTLRGARFHRDEIQELVRFLASAERIAERVSWAEDAASLVKALVANRGEISIRVMRAAADEIERLQSMIYGLRAAADEIESAHARMMTSAEREREACAVLRDEVL